eukprot:954457-Rhodomonas_salina.2
MADLHALCTDRQARGQASQPQDQRCSPRHSDTHELPLLTVTQGGCQSGDTASRAVYEERAGILASGETPCA